MPNRFGTDGLLSNDTRKLVTFKENNMQYIGINDSLKQVIRYRVDNGNINDTAKKCDTAAYLPSDSTIYLVELKGCDIKKACEQILNTMATLGDKLEGLTVHGRAVCSRIPTPDIRSSQVIKLERELAKRKGTFQKASRKLSEAI